MRWTVAHGDLLAIDFGSSNTVAVLRAPDGRARTLLFDGSPLLPSAVFAAGTSELLAGRDAAHMSRDDPARYEPHPKRRIDDSTILLGDREVPVANLIGAVLHRVAGEAARTAGTLPPVILTHPVAWGPARRGVLTEAAHRAGLTVLGMVAEPIAAASYFTTVLGSELGLGQSLAVFDLGGGTLDVAVVRRSGTGLTVTGTGGLDDVGGVDVDAAIIGHLADQLHRQAPQLWDRLANPRHPGDLRDRGLIWQDARAAKEMLSRASSATVHIPGLPAGTHLTRPEFDQLAGPLLIRAVDETGAVLRRTGVPPAQLAGIFLVGGSSRIPLVGHLLHTRLGVPPTVLEQPETAVAEGALHTGAAPRISPRVSGALDRLSAGTAAAPLPAGPPPVPRSRKLLRIAIPAITFLAVAGITLAVLQALRPPGRHPAGGKPPPASSRSATPVEHCPTNKEVQDAIHRDPQGGGTGMTFGVNGDVVCEHNWAAIHALAQRPDGPQDRALIVQRWVNGQWNDVVLGTDICAPEPDTGPPNWARPAGTVPEKVFTAFCKLSYYQSSPGPVPTGTP